MPSADFEAAAAKAPAFTKAPPNEVQLQLYGLYKQATVGDNNVEKPRMMDMSGNAKWNAWKALAGKPMEAAEKEYIALVEALAPAQA